MAHVTDGLNVFILGSPRSGTSITYYAMREVVGLKGRGESHVVPVFQRMLHQFHTYTTEFRQHPGVLAGDLDTRLLRESFQSYLRAFYAKAYGGHGFVDKTPGAEAIRGCDLIYGAFPAARVLLLQRNGIEVVNSFRSKFGASFENACQSWVHVVDAATQMVAARPELLVVDQFDLTNKPQAAGACIAEYLGCPNLASRLATFFTERRVEQQSTHDWTKRLTLADVAWSDAQKAHFVAVCGASMASLGYQA